MQDIGQALEFGRKFLAGSEEGPRDASLLLAHVLDKPAHYPHLHPEGPISEETFSWYKRLLERRKLGEPIAYLRKFQEFMGLRFAVDHRVLIPRPETEILVEEAIKLSRAFSPNWLFADIGCGSGAIGLSLVKMTKDSSGILTDISQDALDVAMMNASNLAVLDRVSFAEGHLGYPLFEMGLEGKLDLVVSNPPYISENEMDALPVEVKKEPVLALNGGKDGLRVIRPLIRQAAALLKPGGYLLMEIGETQAKDCILYIEDIEFFMTPTIIPDLAGLDRIVKVQKRRSWRS
jgi:release factor glutamine methyltransferase